MLGQDEREGERRGRQEVLARTEVAQKNRARGTKLETELKTYTSDLTEERHPDGALGTGRVLSRRRRTCRCAQTLHQVARVPHNHSPHPGDVSVCSRG